MTMAGVIYTPPWHRHRKRSVRLIEMTEEERDDAKGPRPRCMARDGLDWCEHKVGVRCAFVGHPPTPIWWTHDCCPIALCRTHAHWRAGKPYCARHAGEGG